MKEQLTENHKPEAQQDSSNEMNARQPDKMSDSPGFGDMKGIGSLFIWFLIILLICGLIYFLS